MRLKANEIAALVEGKLEGNPDTVVTAAKGVAEAGPDDVAFVANPKYVDQIATTKAGVLLVSDGVQANGRTVIKVKNPQLAFARILWIAYRERLDAIKPGIHPTAVVAPSARIGENVTLGPCTVIEERAVVGRNTKILAQGYLGAGSSIGDDCLIYANVTIREDCSIGNRVVIHPGTVIGSDGFGFVPGEKGHFKIPQMGRVEIGDDVELGANVTIDRATTGATRIGRGTKMDNLVQVAHNVQIGEHCIIVAQTGIAGSTKLGNFVTLAAQSGTAGHLTVGNRATVAARAGVTTDIKDGEVVSGFPARPHREELKRQAFIQKLPELFEKIKKLKNTDA